MIYIANNYKKAVMKCLVMCTNPAKIADKLQTLDSY